MFFLIERGTEGLGYRQVFCHPAVSLIPCFVFLKTGSSYEAHALLELPILLPQPPECWDYRCVHIWEHVSVCGYEHMETGAHKKVMDPLELELQVVVRHWTRVPRTEIASSGREQGTLNHLIILPVQFCRLWCVHANVSK